MFKRISFQVIALCCFFCLNSDGQQTIIKYLSGTGKDHTVTWNFYCTEGRNSNKWTTIQVPSCWELQGFGNYNYGLDWKNSERKVGHEQGLYKYNFSIPTSWEGKRINIVFEGSMTDTKVKINGKLAGPVHQGAFYEFKYDISDLLNYGSSNLLQVKVSKVSSNQSVNAAERQADFWIFGGIFRPVYLEAKPIQHIKRVAINARANGTFMAHVFIEGKGKAESVSGEIETLNGEMIGKMFKTAINHHSSHQTLSAKFKNIKQWSPEFPNLYKVVFSLSDSQGHVIHKVEKRFGFRTVELRKGDGFYVNGTKVRFKGVDYHSFWPSSGRTLSKKLVIRDMNLIKDMNMNAIRLSHYPRMPYLYDVCDSLGLFVADELAGWQASYDTETGHKLVKEMVTRDENHPSIVMWNNGNEGGYNFDLDNDFSKWDIQNRPVNHPGSIFKNIDSQHYPGYHLLIEKLTLGNKVFFPDEFMHALYAGGGGAGLQDYWNVMRKQPLSAGGFIWDYSDGCIVRTDKNDSLDCDGNHDADGILGPYRAKEGSFYTIKEVWSPVHIQEKNISKRWDQRLAVENRFFYTNLNQVRFEWKLIHYPGPFDKGGEEKIIAQGNIVSPDVKPQSCGFLQVALPSTWISADALTIKATDPHGREIYSWTLPIMGQKEWVEQVVKSIPDSTVQIMQTPNKYILTDNGLTVTIDKKNGYIQQVRKGGTIYSLNNGPFEVGTQSSLKSIKKIGNKIKVSFSKDDYEVTYSLENGWLKIAYSYRPRGEYPYFGISFNYPEKKVKGIKWLGHGPDRVWKNRLAGMELGLWQRSRKEYHNEVAIHGYHWRLPKFNGYYADLNWAVLNTTEGPVTIMVSQPKIYLGLFTPQFPPNPGQARAKYPEGDLSFLQAISPIGTKFRKAATRGPSGQPNLFDYGFQKEGHLFKYKNTSWFYFGNSK